VPKYIREGLDWLQKQLGCKPVVSATSSSPAVAVGVN